MAPTAGAGRIRARACRLVIVGLVVLAVSACGSTAPSLTRLRSQATRICLLAGRDLDLIRPPSLPSGEASFLRRGVAVLAPELAQLRDLRAPSDSSPIYQVAIAAFTQEVRAIRHTLRRLDEGIDPVVALQVLQRRLGPLETGQDGAWQVLQIPACVMR